MSTDIVSTKLDELKIVTLDGEEWSARDLLPLAGYSRWEKWNTAIERAIASVNASGLTASDHFHRSVKLIETGKGARREIEDYRITRYGAYILFQNADGSKPEIAAVQAYFAVQTRKQELATPNLGSLEGIAQILAAGQAALDEAKRAREEVAFIQPRAAQADTFRQADGRFTIGDLANNLKAWAASNAAGVKILHEDVYNLAGRIGLIIRGNTVRHNQPTARAIEAGWVLAKDKTVETKNHGTFVKISAHLTPRGYGRLWDAAITNIQTQGVVLPDLKEIA